MHRFFTDQSIQSDTIHITDREQISHISRVLRLRAGDRCIVFDGTGTECECELVQSSKDEIVLLVIERRACITESRRSVTLYTSILKGDHFELVLQKATEVGVRSIVPIITDRTIVRGLTAPKRERYTHIIREATEQCGGCVIPALHNAMSFAEALSVATGSRILLYEGTRTSRAPDEYLPVGDTVSVVIGPEGGFTDDEVLSAKEAGFSIASLGPRILRAETAAIVACAIAVRA